MKPTAVTYLYYELHKLRLEYECKTITEKQFVDACLDLFSNAKTREKNQIMLAYLDGSEAMKKLTYVGMESYYDSKYL